MKTELQQKKIKKGNEWKGVRKRKGKDKSSTGGKREK